MTTPLEVYKALRSIKEDVFLGRADSAFSELRKLLENLPKDLSIDWFACNIIDVAKCPDLLKFYDEFGGKFTLGNCSNLYKLASCLATRGYSEDLKKVVSLVINQGRGSKLLDVISTKSKDAVLAVYKALTELKEFDLANNIISEACRAGLKEVCPQKAQAMYA